MASRASDPSPSDPAPPDLAPADSAAPALGRRTLPQAARTWATLAAVCGLLLVPASGLPWLEVSYRVGEDVAAEMVAPTQTFSGRGGHVALGGRLMLALGVLGAVMTVPVLLGRRRWLANNASRWMIYAALALLASTYFAAHAMTLDGYPVPVAWRPGETVAGRAVIEGVKYGLPVCLALAVIGMIAAAWGAFACTRPSTQYVG